MTGHSDRASGHCRSHGLATQRWRRAGHAMRTAVSGLRRGWRNELGMLLTTARRAVTRQLWSLHAGDLVTGLGHPSFPEGGTTLLAARSGAVTGGK